MVPIPGFQTMKLCFLWLINYSFLYNSVVGIDLGGPALIKRKSFHVKKRARVTSDDDDQQQQQDSRGSKGRENIAVPTTTSQAPTHSVASLLSSTSGTIMPTRTAVTASTPQPQASYRIMQVFAATALTTSDHATVARAERTSVPPGNNHELSSIATRGPPITVKADSLGNSDRVPKPSRNEQDDDEDDEDNRPTRPNPNPGRPVTDSHLSSATPIMHTAVTESYIVARTTISQQRPNAGPSAHREQQDEQQQQSRDRGRQKVALRPTIPLLQPNAQINLRVTNSVGRRQYSTTAVPMLLGLALSTLANSFITPSVASSIENRPILANSARQTENKPLRPGYNQDQQDQRQDAIGPAAPIRNVVAVNPAVTLSPFPPLHLERPASAGRQRPGASQGGRIRPDKQNQQQQQQRQVAKSVNDVLANMIASQRINTAQTASPSNSPLAQSFPSNRGQRPSRPGQQQQQQRRPNSQFAPLPQLPRPPFVSSPIAPNNANDQREAPPQFADSLNGQGQDQDDGPQLSADYQSIRPTVAPPNFNNLPTNPLQVLPANGNQPAIVFPPNSQLRPPLRGGQQTQNQQQTNSLQPSAILPNNAPLANGGIASFANQQRPNAVQALVGAAPGQSAYNAILANNLLPSLVRPASQNNPYAQQQQTPNSSFGNLPMYPQRVYDYLWPQPPPPTTLRTTAFWQPGFINRLTTAMPGVTAQKPICYFDQSIYRGKKIPRVRCPPGSQVIAVRLRPWLQ